MLPVVVKVEDSSRVAEVRRAAADRAVQEGLDERRAATAALVATEAATNLFKYAVRGEVHISGLGKFGAPGVQILSLDHGPGIENLQQCLADGYSTSGTLGGGLGGIARMSDEFDIYSQPGKGTAMVSCIYRTVGVKPRHSAALAAVQVPFPNEAVCGDDWAFKRSGNYAGLIVADGLGHGMYAAEAARAAAVTFARCWELPPAELLEMAHRALRGTRGAAVAVASIDFDKGAIRYSGVGNIVGMILGGPKAVAMMSHNGTVGHEARRFQEFHYVLPQNGLVIMHSDGLVSSWNPDAYPALLRRHPAVIAGILYRDANRGRDDVCVVVVRSDGSEHSSSE